jgi:LPS-assembly protein
MRGIGCWPELPAAEYSEAYSEDLIEMTSGGADIQVNGDATFTGPIEIRNRARSLKSASATFNKETETFSAVGGIEYQDQLNKVIGESVSYNTQTGLLIFTNSEFVVGEVPARGTADKLEISEAGKLEIQKVTYTSCPEGNNDWVLRAKSLEIDADKGMGTARGASIAFKGVPFFYWPYFTYPVSDNRKSGLLFPKLGSSDQRGFEFTQPIYWNISPGMDATIVPHYMSDRGLQLGTEYRYLTRNNKGLLWGDYLKEDDLTGEDRWRYDVKTTTMLPWEWRARINAEGVSDENYFEDMNSNISQTSQVALRRQAGLEYYDSVWTMFMQVQDFQTLDPLIPQSDEPYTEAPQIVANAYWRDGPIGLEYGFDSEATYFTRDESVKGLRAHVRPKIALPLQSRGVYLVPEAELDYTAYSLEDQAAGDPSNPDRMAPILSVDSGAKFERLSGKNNGAIITIEPRAQYVYIPYREQDDIPIFDTIRPDFNLVQVFRKNGFVGYDRLSDTNQVSLGLTSRVLDTSTGQELFKATIAQSRFLETSEVTLPGELPGDVRQSSYIAEVGARIWGNWNADARYQYNADSGASERSSIRFQYSPEDDRAVNLSYRYVRNSVEQTDVSFAWPIIKGWSAIGRYNYSLLEKQPLDEFLGLEYSSCCWGIRLVGRKSVARSTGEQDTSISFQFVLKGFSGIGSQATESLRRDILGYSKF